MNEELSLFLVKKVEGDINSLQNKLHDIDKLVLSLEHRISVITLRLDKEERELDKLHDRKIGSLLAKNWSKLPTLAIIIGGLLWFANWLYDLPSATAQQEQISNILKHIDYKNNK